MHARMAEIAWTAVPVVILVGMAIPAARALIRMDEARDAGLAVKVTGYERRWRYEYLGSGVGFYSSLAQDPSRVGLLLAGADPATDQDLPPRVDHPLVVPVGTRVRLLLSGADLKHSWWVPDLAVRSDASPGLTGVAWFTADRLGRYQGQCAQRCGHDHGRTPIVVEVVSQADFAQWLAAQQAAALAAGASGATTAMATDPRVP